MERRAINYSERNLSYSQLVDWMGCPYRHHLSYNLGYRPKTDSTPLLLGSFFHEAIAEIIRGRDPHPIIEACVEEEMEKIESGLFQDAIEIIGEQAIDLAIRADEFMGISAGEWETVYLEDDPLIERKMLIPMKGWAGYVGIADWVARHRKTGLVWLLDWKTRGRLQDPKSEELNLQLMSYVHQLQELGVEVDRAGIVQVLSKLPVEPKRNKNGSMSRVKITTDWDTYEKALIKARLDPADYQDMRDKLDARFFELVELYFSPDEINNAWHGIVRPTSEAIQSDVLHTRNMSTWNCKYCAFRDPCLADLRGYDAQSILSDNYERKEV